MAAEPMIFGRVDRADRIGAVTQISADQFCGQGASDLKIGDGHLLVNWGQIP